MTGARAPSPPYFAPLQMCAALLDCSPYKLIFMKHFLILVFCGFAVGAAAQTAIDRQVTASQGGSASTDRLSLNWTLGEPAVATLSTPSGLLTQGFQQPTLRVEPVSVLPKHPFMTADIRVAPNPTASEINVFFPAGLSEEVWLELSDLHGKPILREKTDPAGTWRMDVSAYPPGSYLLRCVTARGEMISIHRILKTK